MTQGRCATHGVVTTTGGGYCPYCNGQSTFVESNMEVLNNSYDAMTSADSRPAGPNLESQKAVQNEEGWKVKSSGRMTVPCVACLGLIIIIFPAILAVGEIDHGNKHTPTRKAGKILSPLAIIGGAAIIFWWLRVYQRGGVPTLGQERSCNYSYQYYEKPTPGREGMILSLVFSKFKRYNNPSGLEHCRAACFVFFILTLVIVSLIFTFTSRSCPSCTDSSEAMDSSSISN